MDELIVYRSVLDRGLHPIVTDPDAYVEQFWLPVLGPSAVWLLRRLDRLAPAAAYGVRSRIDAATLARAIGLSERTTPNAPLPRTLLRLVQFNVLEHIGEQYGVPTHLPELTTNMVARLPEPYRSLHLQREPVAA